MFLSMKRTQIQVPDQLYLEALQVADFREISMAELVRRGLEYMVSVTPLPHKKNASWELPEPQALGATDVFSAENWREELHMGRLYAAEPPVEYGDQP